MYGRPAGNKTDQQGGRITMGRHQRLGNLQPCGFTLLEVMIAMAILATTLIVVFQSQSQSISMANDSRSLTVMSLLAQSKMTDMESMSTLPEGVSKGNFGVDYPDYDWQIDISQSEIISFYKVEVVVRNRKLSDKKAYHLVFYRPKTI
jgi:general secretion pathway protein I